MKETMIGAALFIAILVNFFVFLDERAGRKTNDEIQCAIINSNGADIDALRKQIIDLETAFDGRVSRLEENAKYRVIWAPELQELRERLTVIESAIHEAQAKEASE